MDATSAHLLPFSNCLVTTQEGAEPGTEGSASPSLQQVIKKKGDKNMPIS